MNKIASRLLMVMLLIAGVSMSSCSKKKDKKDLLETVPASTLGVYILDLDEAMNQLEIKSEKGDVSYCSELSDVLSLSGMSKKDKDKLDLVLNAASMTCKTLVVFEYEENPWATFFVEDEDDFIKLFEKEEDADFDDEDGYKVWENMAIKDDQVWISPKIDTDDIDKFRKLDKEDTFAAKYEKITNEMTADDISAAYFVDLKIISQIAERSSGAEFNMVLSVIFDDARYVFGTSKLTNSLSSGEVRVLNSKFEPATFNLPMATIDAKSMSLLNNDAPFIAALAVDKELFVRIKTLMSKSGALSGNDEEIFTMLESINGTAGASLASSTDGIAFMNFANPNAPAMFSQMFMNEVDTTLLQISSQGNTLIARLPGTPLKGRGTPPAELVGQYAGLYIDFTKDKGNFVKGADISELGKIWITLGPDGKGIKLSSQWNAKNPLRTLLSVGLKLVKSMSSGELSFPEFEELGNHFGGGRSDYGYEEPDSLAYSDYADYEYDYAGDL